MPDIGALKSRYFTSAAPTPATFAGCEVKPLVDALDYNKELVWALASIGDDPDPAANTGDYILVHNWWLGLSGGQWVPPDGYLTSTGPAWATDISEPPYHLDAGTPLLEVLKEKARRGVDVLVMGWVSFSVMGSRIAQLSGAAHIARINVLTIQSIVDLRSEPAIGGKAIVNMVGHTAGACHAKLVVVGSATEAIGFTGGLDFVQDRLAEWDHPGQQQWHDVVARIRGPAVQALYDWFGDVWNENVAPGGTRREPRMIRIGPNNVPHALPSTPAFPARTLPNAAAGTHHVQSLRTFPASNYRFFSIAPSAPPLSFAPRGLWEVRDAWKKALESAETYVYIEDQAFTSQEVLSAIRTALKAPNSELRVILLMKGRGDPNDPEADDHPLLCQSINHGLLKDLDPVQISRVRAYRRWGDTRVFDGSIVSVTDLGGAHELQTDVTLPGPVGPSALARAGFVCRTGGRDLPIVANAAAAAGAGLTIVVKTAPGPAPGAGPVRIWLTTGIVIHAKTTLVDDHWAMIGSANCMRRSLYTDCEHTVAFLDENDNVVREFRKALWAHHFRHRFPEDFDDIKGALHAWEPSWFSPGAAPARPTRPPLEPGPPYLEEVPLPLTPDVELAPAQQDRYDLLDDPDSREPWGFIFPPG